MCVYCRNTIQDLIFVFTKLLALLVILSTIKLYTCLKNKIYLLLQFIKKIVKIKFFFTAEFDISTSTKMLEILQSSRKFAFFTFFQLHHVESYYLQFFDSFYLECLIQNYDYYLKFIRRLVNLL